ncbi:MAG: pseudouridine synthase, partial [Campylobacterales bacterium]
TAIRKGWDRVGEETVKNPALKVAKDAPVFLDDAPLLPPVQNRYILLYKPENYVCSHKEEGNYASALELVDLPHRDRLHFAGRLDADTTGLVLLTDDGEWSHRVTSPRKQCGKTYRAILADPLPIDALKQLESGVVLRGEEKPTLPAQVEPLGLREVRLTIFEGKYHQVKRMFAAVGNRVETLHRERIGALTLEGLQPGGWRHLSSEERALF